MSSSAPAVKTSDKPYCPVEWLKTHMTTYHMVVASVLGGVTVAFVVVIALLIICALNFNPLGWVE